MAFFRGEEGSVKFKNGTGTKKVSFNGIVTGSSLSSTVGDLSTVSISFITSGAISNAA